MVGREFNLGSPKQLQAILFDELGLPKTKRIKTGYTTDADALAGLYEQTGHPLLSRCCGTATSPGSRPWSTALIPMVDDDGRIHTTFNQTGRGDRPAVLAPTRTCRTSRSAPPRAGGSGSAFVVGAGFESLMTADYSQIEMRIMAHLSEDAGLIEAFHVRRGPAHLRRVQGVRPAAGAGRPGAAPADQGDVLRPGLRAVGVRAGPAAADHRRRGARADGRPTSSGSAACATTCATWSTQARQDGYTETILGRRRYLPDLTSDNRQRREMAERMALNAPIQGCAADIIKVAMLGVDRGAARARACAPGCCCRCTTSWCSRSRRGSGRRSRRWSGREMGGGLPAGRRRSTCPSASAAPGTTRGH